jgi:dCMP deaminase
MGEGPDLFGNHEFALNASTAKPTEQTEPTELSTFTRSPIHPSTHSPPPPCHNPPGMQERPSWDSYFMQIAHLVKTRATCPRRSVGALIVRDKHILCTGYNGAPKGIQHCPELGPTHDWPVGCLRAGHCIRALHAEQNALLQAAMIGIPCQGASI